MSGPPRALHSALQTTDHRAGWDRAGVGGWRGGQVASKLPLKWLEVSAEKTGRPRQRGVTSGSPTGTCDIGRGSGVGSDKRKILRCLKLNYNWQGNRRKIEELTS